MTHEQTPTTPRRVHRPDGWTPERIRIFLHALAGGAGVADAARAAGMSREDAYAFRESPDGQAFAAAWRAADELARRRSLDAVVAEIIASRLRRLRRLVQLHGLVELPGANGEPDEWQQAISSALSSSPAPGHNERQPSVSSGLSVSEGRS